MKKVILLFAVVGAIACVACQSKPAQEAAPAPAPTAAPAPAPAADSAAAAAPAAAPATK
jgi:hypothetical protein